ncbi:MAG TPA: phosphate ABC transporter permease subunit PstC [Deltaproteobacteria bacterium]|nr:phosphate ABC transporter permease subunit PstC [Deltaproteobacteria bacterium]
MKTSRKDPFDLVFSAVTAGASWVVLLLVAAIFIVLLIESLPSIREFGFTGFVLSSDWNPVEESFGALPSIYGTAVTTVLSLVMAVPVALGIAVFTTEIAPSFLKGLIGTAVELLAAIPSIIYGMWGLFTLAPIMGDYIEPVLQEWLGGLPVAGALFEGTPIGVDLLTASLILSIMIIPFTASLSRDAFLLTPSVVKESAYALGATRWEVIRSVVIPHARLGIFGGVVLSLGRALGETMAVAFVLGSNHEITSSLLDAAATITVTLANEFTEADTDLYLSALYHLALILFVMSFAVLAAAKFFLLRAARK